MLFVVLLAALTCVAMLCLIFFFPSVSIRHRLISTYWFAPLAGALLLLLFGKISVNEVLTGLTASAGINPLQLLVLFLSMTLLSVFLDQLGFFRWLASAVLRRAKGSQKKLFCTLYLLVSVLTVFTSNDVVILTFTPFLCCFAKNAKIDPLPYLMAEFVAANTWSMALLIGNPTNICLCTSAGDVTFLSYLRVMLLPTVFAGVTTFVLLRFLFRKQLEKPMEHDHTHEPLQNRIPVAVGLVHLGGCILLLVFSSVIELPMWEITLLCFLSLYLSMSVYFLCTKKGMRVITDCFRRAPWEIVPFVLSMFVLVLALERSGATEALSGLLSQGIPLVNFGLVSFLLANLVNNLPMSVFFSAVVGVLPAQLSEGALFASVAGSNLGAYFTPIGALAGILWMSLLRRYGVPFSFGRFVRYGALIALPAMAMALLGLWIVL